MEYALKLLAFIVIILMNITGAYAFLIMTYQSWVYSSESKELELEEEHDSTHWDNTIL